ncbi:5-oxoprolinase subunit PxpB [Alicyclobacillus tolerans]|uniref:Inhibitor of KinA n=1 Tax=Alicyclobacillus tolerans TaxID=90970 RepID=A0A1M6NJ96_9BACL|nr:5-oxoprolinase subunit PxpB [Alicyclobacillus montanus]SHJ95739.1 inhibitor of KinA [Alicyclobacillus montanus]
MEVKIEAYGDSALLVKFSSDFLHSQNRVRFFRRCIERSLPTGFLECVPGMTDLTFYYQPLQYSFFSARKELLRWLAETPVITEEDVRFIEIPICYHSSLAPDLDFVAASHHLSTDQVIALHSSSVYEVQMIGFAPGFPYLSGLPGQLATPRRATPRLRISPGSVGIAGTMTGIYTYETPGGWQIIGRTPWVLFDTQRNPPSLLQLGDRVQWRPISLDEFMSYMEMMK